MSKKRLVLIIAIVFMLGAIILLFQNTNWEEKASVACFISLVIGTVGSIISLFIPTTYTCCFNKSDWQEIESNDYRLCIKAKKHGLGNSPKVQVFMENDKVYQEVEVELGHNDKGDIIIGATKDFSGKMKIS